MSDDGVGILLLILLAMLAVGIYQVGMGSWGRKDELYELCPTCEGNGPSTEESVDGSGGWIQQPCPTCDGEGWIR